MYFVFLEIIMWFVGLGVVQHRHPRRPSTAQKLSMNLHIDTVLAWSGHPSGSDQQPN